jgi:DNA-binding NarL/FixJ family response regulator
MSTATSDPGVAQCFTALRRANEVRCARASLKRLIVAGRLSAADVIVAGAPETNTMEIIELLMSQRAWGEARCRRLLARVPLPEAKTVGSLTERQRDVLVAMLRGPHTSDLAAGD